MQRPPPLRVELGDALRVRIQQTLDAVKVAVPDQVEQLVALFGVGARPRGAAVQLAADERDYVVVAAVLGQGQRRGGVAVRIDPLVRVRAGLQDEAGAGEVAVEHRVVQGRVLVVLRAVQPHQVGAGGHQRADGREVPLLGRPEEARSGSAMLVVLRAVQPRRIGAPLVRCHLGDGVCVPPAERVQQITRLLPELFQAGLVGQGPFPAGR